MTVNYLVRWPLTFNRIRKDKLSNTFGRFAERYSGAHWGWDFAAPVGTPVYAVADGEVSKVYGTGADKEGYGLVIEICFTYQGCYTYAAYCHMSRSLVRGRQPVKMGELIGYTGKSGNGYNLPTSEDHLHFEFRTLSRPSPGGHPYRFDPREIYNVCPINHTIVDTQGCE